MPKRRCWRWTPATPTGPAPATRPGGRSASCGPGWSTPTRARSRPTCPTWSSRCRPPAGRPTRPSPSATSPTRLRWPGLRRADMSWRVGVVHTTKVTYSGAARASYNECRMTPPTMARQTALATSVRTGSNVPIWSYRDYWGTTVSSFDIQEPHEELLVKASSTVQTSAAPEEPVPLPWPDLHEGAADSYVLEYLGGTRRTTMEPDVVAAVTGPGGAGAPARAARERDA